MTTTVTFTLILASLSLVISLWAALRTNQLTINDIRLSRRTDLHNLL